jgi:hypothetical protein
VRNPLQSPRNPWTIGELDRRNRMESKHRESITISHATAGYLILYLRVFLMQGIDNKNNAAKSTIISGDPKNSFAMYHS